MPDDSFALDAKQRALLDLAFEEGYFHWAGMRLLVLSERTATVVFRPRAEMLTRWNSLNGGVLNGLVELPSFLALLTALGEDELPVTNDIFVQHLRPLPADADYRLEGRLLHRSRTMAWTEVAVTIDDRTVSMARITKTIIARPAI